MNKIQAPGRETIWSVLATALMTLILSSCGVGRGHTREELWAKLYSERPRSIVVMPPINKTPHVAAKEYFYSSIAAPLAERGYYVYSPYLVMDVFEQESAGDAELFVHAPLGIFRQFFDTDAVLFTTINRWEKSIISNTIRVDVEYLLRSTKTGETLFSRRADISVDLSVTATGGLLDLLVNAIATATTSKIVGARKANYFLLRDMPEGPYAPMHGKDQGLKVEALDLRQTSVR